MNDILLNYIVQAILGGAAGYITNDYAINMLFKEYTPLKIGGVIKKTREEFIENLSSMVESDIINRDKLQEILSDEKLKIKFEDMTADFYNNCMNEAVGNDTWDKIISDDTDRFIQGLIVRHFPGIYDVLLRSLDIRGFLSDSQLDSISIFFYDAVLETLKKNEGITGNVLLSVYNGNFSLTPDKIIDKKVSHQIVENIVDSLRNNTVNCDNSELKKALDLTGIEKAVRRAFQVLRNKHVHEVININNEIIVKIDDAVLSYIDSDKGYNFLLNLFSSLFNHGRTVNKTISELLDSNFEERLKSYLIDAIPGITEKIVNWIKENNDSIDRLLEESIDEVIAESDGLKAKLLSTIKNAYLNNLSKKYSIVDKIISFVESNTEPERLSKYLSAKIIDVMNNITVGEFVEEAEANGLTPQKLTEITAAYLKNNFTKILNQSVLFIKDIKISSLVPALSTDDELIDKMIVKFKESCSSQGVNDFLTDKLFMYTDNILSSELKDIVSEYKINSLSLNLNSFIIHELKNNEADVKRWMCERIYGIAGKSNISLSNEIISFLNEELYKKYEAYSKDLRNTELSDVIDKLKSIDNIANNSSEYLRSYAIKNTDAILKGSVKPIVTDNLNKLNDDELVDLANDFIGRELKPIMFFGGALGVIAGLILAAFQNKALNMQEISITNMLLYAFVGFITNVVAINMIFRPYRENKLLSKIPFFRNFSLGYIVKNQKIFAEKTSYFIDNTLLNKESISELFEAHEQNIKSSLINTASDNDYRVIKSLLSNNKINIVNKLFSFFKGKTCDNLNKLSCFLYEKIGKIKLFSAIRDSRLFKNHYDFVKPEAISKVIYSFMDSDRYVRMSFIDSYISGIIDRFNINTFKDGIYSYEQRYAQFGSKKINEIINKNQLKNVENFTAKKINEILLSRRARDKMFESLSSMLKSSVNKDNTIEELFDGKIKNYIDSHLPALTEKLLNMLNKSIQDSKPRITVMIQSEIKNQLGFIEKSMYSLMGGDEIIDELLKKIINSKIPSYLELKKHEINKIVSTTVDERLYKSKAKVIYSFVGKLRIKELADNYMSEKSERIEYVINTGIRNLINRSESVKAGSILDLFYLNDLHTALKVYGSEADAFAAVISENTRENKENILGFLSILTSVSYRDIFKYIKYEDVENSLSSLIAQLNENNSPDKLIGELIGLFISENSDMNIGHILNKEEFIASSESYIHRLIERDENEKTLKEIFIGAIDDAVTNNLDFVSNDSKDYLFNIFIESTINSLKRNLDEILKSVEFDKITREEIEKMEPKRIHEMFNSFGKKYFRRLMLYGLGGFVFGINVYIGISLTALKAASQFIGKEK